MILLVREKSRELWNKDRGLQRLVLPLLWCVHVLQVCQRCLNSYGVGLCTVIRKSNCFQTKAHGRCSRGIAMEVPRCWEFQDQALWASYQRFDTSSQAQSWWIPQLTLVIFWQRCDSSTRCLSPLIWKGGEDRDDVTDSSRSSSWSSGQFELDELYIRQDSSKINWHCRSSWVNQVTP